LLIETSDTIPLGTYLTQSWQKRIRMLNAVWILLYITCIPSGIKNLLFVA